MSSPDAPRETDKPFPNLIGYLEQPDDEIRQGLRLRYTEFVVNHHTALRRLGVATFIAGIPIGAVVGTELEVSPPLVMMGIMGSGVTEYSLGVAGRDIETRQQG